MNDLTCLPLHLNTDTRVCRAIIETPKGSRIKFRYDPQARNFMLGRVLPEGMIHARTLLCMLSDPHFDLCIQRTSGNQGPEGMVVNLGKLQPI